MTSTNDGKDVKSNQTSGQKVKTYYIELYKSLDTRLNDLGSGEQRTRVVCEAWRRVHSLCQHSAPSTHPHLQEWIQRHTAQTILQTDWQQSNNKDEQHAWLEEAIDGFTAECNESIATRNGVASPWEATLLERSRWFRTALADPWGHPVLKALVNSEGGELTDEEVIEWLKEEKDIMFVTRLRQLAASRRCVDLARRLASAVMDRERASAVPEPDTEPTDKTISSESITESPFVITLRNEAGFTKEVWSLVKDIEFVLLYSESRARCIELAKQIPYRNAYQLVERLRNRLESYPREKKVWKNAKEVATLISQVVITRCMVVPFCTGEARVALYGCARSLVRLLSADKLPAAAATLAALAVTSRHLHTLAVAVHNECKDERRSFVCELYVRAITAGMNELEKLKLKTEKEPEARLTEQILSTWFTQLGLLLSASARMNCECILTAFSIHPTPAMFQHVKNASPLEPLHKDVQEPKPETNTEFGSWATDSRTQTNLVKTSETLNLKTQKQTNVLSTAMFTEGEALGLEAELCQDLAVLISGPRVKTLSWDMERETLLENCRTYMERTHGGTRALITELKYLNLDPRSFQHLPEEDDDENDLYYGIEKGYEHLVETPEEIWQDALSDSERTESAHSTEESAIDIPKRKKKSRHLYYSSEEVDPLNIEGTERIERQERPHSKERSKERRKKKNNIKEDTFKDADESKEHSQEKTREIRKKEKKKERKERKKKDKSATKDTNIQYSDSSLKNLVALKVGRTEDMNLHNNRNQCITDSDYDSQGKSSIYSEGNDPSTFNEGFISNDEIKLPAKTLKGIHQSNITDEFSVSKRNIATKTADRQKSQSIIKNSELYSSNSNSYVTEEVKRNIKKFIELRRNNIRVEPISALSSKSHYHANINKNLQTVNDNIYTNIKTSQISNMSKANINRERQLSILKDEVNNFLKNCNNQGNCNKQKLSNVSVATFIPSTAYNEKNSVDGISNRKIQQAVMKQNTKHHNNSLYKSVNPTLLRNVESPSLCQYKEFLKQRSTNSVITKKLLGAPFDTPSQIQFQEFLRHQNSNQQSTPLSNKIEPTIQKLTEDHQNLGSVTSEKLHTYSNNKEKVKIEETLKKYSSISLQNLTSSNVIDSSQNPYQDFLKELRDSNNAGVTNDKQEVKVQHASDKTTSKQTNPQKKVDNTLNTFSRLSYLHKNKQNDNKHKHLIDQPSHSKRMSMEELTNLGINYDKISNIQAKGEVAIKKVDKAKASNDNAKVVQKINHSNSIINKQYPIISDMLSSGYQCHGGEISGNEINRIDHKIVSPVTSNLSEKDQNDLLLLLRQKSMMKPKSQTKSVYSKNINDSIIRTKTTFNVNPKTNDLSVSSCNLNWGHSGTENSDVSVIKPCDTMTSSTTSELKKIRTVKVSDKGSSLKQTPKHNEVPEWKNVLNDLLAQKTPSRGPNALDITLKKDSFEKRMSCNVNVKPKVANISHTKANRVIEGCTSKICSMNLKQASTSRENSFHKKSLPQDLKQRQEKKLIDFDSNTNVSRKIQLKTKERQFPSVIQNGKDPFISGIPNSDFDLLGELMDDDLRQEIGELLADDEAYGMSISNQKVVVRNKDSFCLPNKTNPAKSHKPQIIIDTRQSLSSGNLVDSTILDEKLQNKLNSDLKPISMTTVTNSNTQKSQIISNKVNALVTVQNSKCKIGINNQSNITAIGKNINGNVKNISHTVRSQLGASEGCVNDQGQQIVITVPQRTTPNVLLISNELVYKPLALQVEQPPCHKQSNYEMNSHYVASNQLSNNYVAINPTSGINVAVNQTTYMEVNQTSIVTPHFPIVRPVIIDRGITVPVIQKVPPNIPAITTQNTNVTEQKSIKVINKEINPKTELIKISEELNIKSGNNDNYGLQYSLESSVDKSIIDEAITERPDTQVAAPKFSATQSMAAEKPIDAEPISSVISSSVTIPTITAHTLDASTGAAPTVLLPKITLPSVTVPSIEKDPIHLDDMQNTSRNTFALNNTEKDSNVKTSTKNSDIVFENNTQSTIGNNQRIELKRMSIKNRQSHLRSCNPPIALTYEPLCVKKQTLQVKNERLMISKSDIKIDIQSKNGPEEPEKKEQEENLTNASNDDCNLTSKIDSPCRRILLRSSNSLKDKTITSISPNIRSSKVIIKPKSRQGLQSKEKLKIRNKKIKKNKIFKHPKSVKLIKLKKGNEKCLDLQKIDLLNSDIEQNTKDKVEKNTEDAYITEGDIEDQITPSVIKVTSNLSEKSKLVDPLSIQEESNLMSHKLMLEDSVTKNITNPNNLTGFQETLFRNHQSISTANETTASNNITRKECQQTDSQFINTNVNGEQKCIKDSAKTNHNSENTDENQVYKVANTPNKITTKQYGNLSNETEKSINENLLEYKDKIMFEELPNNTNDPLKKYVRIKLPGGNVFRATISGKLNVNIDSLFEEPSIKAMILNNINSKKKCTLNIKQVMARNSVKGLGALPTGLENRSLVHTIPGHVHNLTSRPKEIIATRIVTTQVRDLINPLIDETINLISDDEEDTVESFKTEFGSFRTVSINEDLFLKHQKKLSQKCEVKINRCNIMQEMLNSKLTKEITVLAEKRLLPQDVIDVIEIDDSSNDSDMNAHKFDLKKHMLTENVGLLKDRLLKDLGVKDDIEELKNTNLIGKDVMEEHATSENTLENVNQSNVETKTCVDENLSSIEVDTNKVKSKECVLKLEKCDNLIEKMKIQKNMCFVNLVRCDDTLKNENPISAYTSDDLEFERPKKVGEDFNIQDKVLSLEPILRRSGSLSILNDFGVNEEVRSAPSSPSLIQNFEMPLIVSKDASFSNTIFTDTYISKSVLHALCDGICINSNQLCYGTEKGNSQLDGIPTEKLFDKEEKIYKKEKIYQALSLVKIITNFFVNNSNVIERLRTTQESYRTVSNSSTLKRKYEEVLDKHRQKISKTDDYNVPNIGYTHKKDFLRVNNSNLTLKNETEHIAQELLSVEKLNFSDECLEEKYLKSISDVIKNKASSNTCNINNLTQDDILIIGKNRTNEKTLESGKIDLDFDVAKNTHFIINEPKITQIDNIEKFREKKCTAIDNVTLESIISHIKDSVKPVSLNKESNLQKNIVNKNIFQYSVNDRIEKPQEINYLITHFIGDKIHQDTPVIKTNVKNISNDVEGDDMNSVPETFEIKQNSVENIDQRNTLDNIVPIQSGIDKNCLNKLSRSELKIVPYNEIIINTSISEIPDVVTVVTTKAKNIRNDLRTPDNFVNDGAIDDVTRTDTTEKETDSGRMHVSTEFFRKEGNLKTIHQNTSSNISDKLFTLSELEENETRKIDQKKQSLPGVINNTKAYVENVLNVRNNMNLDHEIFHRPKKIIENVGSQTNFRADVVQVITGIEEQVSINKLNIVPGDVKINLPEVFTDDSTVTEIKENDSSYIDRSILKLFPNNSVLISVTEENDLLYNPSTVVEEKYSSEVIQKEKRIVSDIVDRDGKENDFSENKQNLLGIDNVTAGLENQRRKFMNDGVPTKIETVQDTPIKINQIMQKSVQDDVDVGMLEVLNNASINIGTKQNSENKVDQINVRIITDKIDANIFITSANKPQIDHVHSNQHLILPFNKISISDKKNDKMCVNIGNSVDEINYTEEGMTHKEIEGEDDHQKIDNNILSSSTETEHLNSHENSRERINLNINSQIVDTHNNFDCCSETVTHNKRVYNKENVIIESNLVISLSPKTSIDIDGENEHLTRNTVNNDLQNNLIYDQSNIKEMKGNMIPQDNQQLHNDSKQVLYDNATLMSYYDKNTCVKTNYVENKIHNLYVTANKNHAIIDDDKPTISYNEDTICEFALPRKEREDIIERHAISSTKTSNSNTLQENVTLVYNGDSLKGSIYKNPIVGTCYLFCDTVSDDNNVNVIQALKSKVFEDRYKDERDVDTGLENGNFDVIIPKITYSKEKLKYENVNIDHRMNRKNLKRKIDSIDNKLHKRYRKGKNIDYPKFTIAAMTETGYGKEYKRLFDYCSSIKFSFSQPFHKEHIDVSDILKCWPITETLVNVDLDKNESFLFVNDDFKNKEFDPLKQTLAEEISSEYVEPQWNSEDINENNFNMGFGERSDRVKQNSGDRNNISKVSAVTLSDVKQSQPFLLSESERSNDTCKELHRSKIDQITTIDRYFSYIQLRDKVRSFFRKTTIDLHYNWLKDNIKNKNKTVDDYGKNNSLFPYDFFSSDFIEPAPMESAVYVVQVGQLPVSAAAQNPVSCDPRVTQVTDASPSQCSAQNSPHGDSQSPSKTEYTELTTADLSLPSVHDYERHIETQESSKVPINNENIPVEIEVSSEIKNNVNEGLSRLQDERKCNESDDLQALVNKHINNIEYSFDSNDNPALEGQSNSEIVYESIEKNNSELISHHKQQNGSLGKTDQIAHAMSAAGITTSPEPIINENTTTQTLVNMFSQKICQEVPSSNSQNNFHKASINAMTLQQALAQILPPPLNHTTSQESNQVMSNSSVTSQVLHIVQGKNANGSQITVVDNTQHSVITNSNTPVLHIVHNKTGNTHSAANSATVQHANTYSGLSLVDTGLQQGNNQLLHIVNTGTQKNNASGQLLKRVNLLTNLTNVQGSNEQKMVQFVCKSADGKSIQLNAPHQRSMVLRLQPFESPNIQGNLKTSESQDSSPTSNNSALNKESITAQHEIKSRSVYEENYAKFIQSSTNKTIPEKSTSLPKFNQAFGKQVFQDGSQKTNDINTNSSHLSSDTETECQSSENNLNLDHIRQINSPPLLLRKSPAQTTQTQSNLVQHIKQTIAPMMHGGVIYTRQIPVNIGGGQTINLITVPSTELVEDANQKQHGDIKFVNQGEIESPIIKIVPQNPNTELKSDESNNHQSSTINENSQNTPTQPVLTQMRIKLPMLSKSPQMVSGARIVRPSFFQIQRNVIGGANQPVYQQLVLTAAPPLGQHTIRLPHAQTRQVKVATDSQSSSESQMSSSTLEQLREFDMVLEQVKERSTVQPNSNNIFSKLHTSSTDTTDSTSITSTVTESTQQVLYSIGTNQSLNVAYVNRKTNSTAATATFVRSPDSSGILESPSNSVHVQIPHTITSESTLNEASTQQNQPKAAKVGSKSKSRPKSSSHPTNSVKINTVPPKTSTQKPLEDEQTTQRILYILAEYKEQVENSPDKDKPAPRRRSNPPSNPSGSSKRKKSSGGSRRSGARDVSPIHGEDACRTMGSEDSSCGTSQGDCTENCLETHSPQDSPRKVVRKLTFENETSTTTQSRTPQQRNVIVADGQTITVARGTAGKPATAVLMPANYILPVSMVKGGQQIAIVTNRGPKLLTVGGGDGGTTNALLLQRLIGPAGLKPVLARPGVRHVRLPTAALHNLQAFNLATATTVHPQDTASSPTPAAAPTPPELIETRANSSPWADRESQDVKSERESSPEDSEPWHLPNDYSYEETVRTENMDRTVLDAIPDRYSPDMEAQRIFDKMFDVDSKKSYIVDSQDDSSRCAYDIDASDCDDKVYHQVVQKREGHRQHRLTHVSAAALRHKYAILEHELRLQKSLSEECEDLGVDSPSASELFPEAELLFSSSPAHEAQQHSHTPQPTILNHSGIPQPDIDDQIATDHILQHEVLDDQQDLGVTLGLDEGIVTVSEDGMQATIALDQEEFARSHPNTTFHSEPTEEGEVQPFTITGLKGRHITSTIFHAGRAPATVLVSAPQTTVISQATQENIQNNIKYANIDHIINSPSTHGNPNLSSVLVKDDRLTKFDILTDSRELHLSNTASAIIHSTGNATQVIRRVCYDDDKRDTRYLMDESDGLIAGDDAKMVAEDSSRDATSMADVDEDNSSPERHAELFWESNSASERSESRRRLDFSSDSDKCCKSPFDETNSTDSSGVGTHMRLDSVIKEARLVERAASGSSDDHPPLRTYPPKRYHHHDGDVERSVSGKTRAGFQGEQSESHEVRRRASGRGVVKRGCHCCNGSPTPSRPKKPKKRPTMDFNSN